MNKIYIVGMGPGFENMMTKQAIDALEASDVIVGYTVYIKLLGEKFQTKELLTTPMRQEKERCHLCFKKALEGKTVSLVCSGDAGIYGLASLMYEIGQEYDNVELSVIPGITAANSGAAVLGAPLNHDFCTISLSDLLTPWETIERRLRAALEADFVCAIYNPRSKGRPHHLEQALEIARQFRAPHCPVGLVRKAFRPGEEARVLRLDQFDPEKVDMLSILIIGNAESRALGNFMLTPRGYARKKTSNLGNLSK